MKEKVEINLIINTNKNHFDVKNNWMTFKNPKIERILAFEKDMTIIIPQNDSFNDKFWSKYKFWVNLFVFFVDNLIFEIRELNNSNSHYIRIITKNYLLSNINGNNYMNKYFDFLKWYLFNNIILEIKNISCFLWIWSR